MKEYNFWLKFHYFRFIGSFHSGYLYLFFYFTYHSSKYWSHWLFLYLNYQSLKLHSLLLKQRKVFIGFKNVYQSFMECKVGLSA